MKIDEVVSQTDINNLNAQGYEVIDQIDIDGYTIALTKIPGFMAPMIGAKYQLGFSKSGTDFTDYGQHDKKFVKPNETFPLSKIPKGLSKIKEWIQEYGPVVIASSNSKKTALYNKLFKRAHFDVEPYSVMGQSWLIVS